MARLLEAMVFAVGFGLAFIYLGVRRMVGAGRESRPADARLWGAVGILIGFTIFGGLAWFLCASADPPRDDRPAPSYRDLEP